MFYKKLFTLILLLSYSYLYATPCENPAVALDDLNKKFRYGCFCGEHYPNIKHLSKKSYKDLNKTARKELILQYEKLDAYDDIDAICKEHDLCYIRYAKEANICNDKAYKRFNIIEEEFSKASENNISNEQCKNLAFDIGSIFHTIFLPADDEDTIFDFGMLMVNGAVTVTNKVLQESADTISDNAPRYPLINNKCLLKSINSSQKKLKNISVKVITIQRD